MGILEAAVDLAPKSLGKGDGIEFLVKSKVFFILQFQEHGVDVNLSDMLGVVINGQMNSLAFDSLGRGVIRWIKEAKIIFKFIEIIADNFKVV